MFLADQGRFALLHTAASGRNQLAQTSRAATTDAFGPLQPMPELSSPQREQDAWVSPDGHTIYFVSDRTGNYDIYTATR